MTWQTEDDGKTTVITLLSHMASGGDTETLMSLLEKCRKRNVVLDLKGFRITHAAVNAIMQCHIERNGGPWIRLCKMSDEVRAQFNHLAVGGIVSVFGTREEALGTSQ